MCKMVKKLKRKYCIFESNFFDIHASVWVTLFMNHTACIRWHVALRATAGGLLFSGPWANISVSSNLTLSFSVSLKIHTVVWGKSGSLFFQLQKQCPFCSFIYTSQYSEVKQKIISVWCDNILKYINLMFSIHFDDDFEYISLTSVCYLYLRRPSPAPSCRTTAELHERCRCGTGLWTPPHALLLCSAGGSTSPADSQVSDHSATLQVESHPDKGTNFMQILDCLVLLFLT